MKPRAYLIISMIALLLFMFVQTAAAQDIVAGVKPGDQFTYSVTGSYSSNAPIDQVPADVRARLLDRAQEELWLRGKTLTRQREDAMATDVVREKPDTYGVLPVVLSRQLKLVTAELEFVKELRQDFEDWERARATEQATEPVSPRDASSIQSSRQPARRQKGAPRR